MQPGRQTLADPWTIGAAGRLRHLKNAIPLGAKPAR
jgi:hypothetical protein